MKKFLVLCSFATFLLALSGLSAAQKFDASKDQSLELHNKLFPDEVKNASVSTLSGKLVLNGRDGVVLYDLNNNIKEEIASKPKNLNNTFNVFVISSCGNKIAFATVRTVLNFSNGNKNDFFTIKMTEDDEFTEYLKFNNKLRNKIITFAGSGSKNCSIALWDIATKKPQFLKDLEDKHCSSVLSAAFSPDDAKIATTSTSGTVKIWDVSTLKPLLTFSVGNPGDWAKSAEFDSSGTKIVTASNDKLLKIWDVKTGACLNTIEGHEGPANFAMFCSHDDLIISCSDDNSLKLWDASTYKLYGTFDFDHPVKSACFMADGKALIVQLMPSGSVMRKVHVVSVVNPMTRERVRIDKLVLAALSLQQHKVKTFTSVID